MDNTNKTILIIEDDAGLVRMLTKKLNDVGINVKAVNNGVEALQLIKSEPIKLVLLDLMLPGGMNGLDILEQIKGIPASRDVHVIVLTNLDTMQKAAIDNGADDYIVKSNISLDQVVGKIKGKLQ